MSTRTTTPPPVDCDSCGTEITETKGGFLDCEVVDLHDGTPVKDICRACTEKPLSVLFPHTLKRSSGHPMRRVAAAPAPRLEESVTIGADDVAEVSAELKAPKKK